MWFSLLLRFIVAYLYTLIIMPHNNFALPHTAPWMDGMRLRLVIGVVLVLSCFMLEYELEEYLLTLGKRMSLPTYPR